jgi:hypothetical protein
MLIIPFSGPRAQMLPEHGASSRTSPALYKTSCPPLNAPAQIGSNVGTIKRASSPTNLHRPKRIRLGEAPQNTDRGVASNLPTAIGHERRLTAIREVLQSKARGSSIHLARSEKRLAAPSAPSSQVTLTPVASSSKRTTESSENLERKRRLAVIEAALRADDESRIARLPPWDKHRLSNAPPPVQTASSAHLTPSSPSGSASSPTPTQSHARPAPTQSHARPTPTDTHARPAPTQSHARPAPARMGIHDASSDGFRLPNSKRLQVIKQTLIALTKTCVICYATGKDMDEEHLIGDCPSQKGGYHDEVWKEWRKGLKFTAGRSCFGCGIPKYVCGIRCMALMIVTVPPKMTFCDEDNKTVPLIHDSDCGGGCEWREVLRPIVYIIWHDPDLKESFKTSGYSAGFEWDNEETTKRPYRSWLREREKGALNGLPNYLCMLEFIISLRGLPVVNPDFNP